MNEAKAGRVCRRPWVRLDALLLAAALQLATSMALADNPAKTLEASPNAIEIPKWFKNSFLDVRDDIKEAALEHKRLMLYFGQDGCPYCRQLMQVNFSHKDIVDRTRRNFDAVALNIWGDREVTWLDGAALTEKELAAKLKVQFTPTLLFFDEHGRIVLRANGYYPPHKFRAALDYVAGRMEGKRTFADYLAQASGVPDTGLLHEEPLFMRPPYDFHSSGTAAAKPLAVFFEQAHCSGCDEMHALAFQDSTTRKLLEEFAVARIDLHGDRALVAPDGARTTEARWARTLGVMYVPSVVFFDARAREVFRVEAYLKTFHLQSALEYVASGTYAKEPSFQRYIQARAARLRESGVSVEIWK